MQLASNSSSSRHWWSQLDTGTMMRMSQTVHPMTQRAREALARRDLRGAYDAAQLALRAQPRDARIHAILGVVLSELGDLPAGERHLRLGIELGAAAADDFVNLAVNLVRQGRAEEADVLFARADALSPGNLQVLAQWSRVQELMGNLQRADELLDRAAAASSEQDVELLRVMYLARRGEHSKALARLETASYLNGEAQMERGRIYDQAGRHREAWRDWVEGKAKLAAQAGNVGYQASAVQAAFSRLKQFFVSPDFEMLPRAGTRSDTAQPVFIMGLPRSGTTLVERVLASHSAVRAGGELTFAGEWPQLLDRLLPGAEAFPENLARTWAADQCHIANVLRDHYLARSETHGLLAPGKRLFTDKMPFNEMWLPLVRMAFPQAKIVRVVRHPLDICVSMLSHELTHGFHCGYRIETIVQHIAAICDLTEHFRRELGSADFILRYESLVEQPEQEIRRVLDYLELPFDAACLSFHEDRRYAGTPSYAQVRQAIGRQSVARYRHYREFLEPFMSQLAPALCAWGYEPRHVVT